MKPTSPIVVVANAHDAATARWCAAHARLGVVRMTPADLSRPGWVFLPDEPRRSTIVADGHIVRSAAVAVVMTRLARVETTDLSHIATEDRAYVGSEMTALLLAWLAQLSCPVFNRPTVQCLGGPAWRSERWLRTAIGLGIPVRPFERNSETESATRNWEPAAIPLTGEPEEARVATVAVVGDRVSGTDDPREARIALSLARTAGAHLLSVAIERADSGPRFVAAHPWPDMDDRGVAAGLEALVCTAAGIDPSRLNIA